MYEELIKALRICGSGLYPNPCPFSINERCTFGCWMDTGRKAASALETLTAQLAALQAENAQLKRRLDEMNDFEKSQCAKLLEKLSRVETERAAAVTYIEKRMVDDVVAGNEPCDICAMASDMPCESCTPKWRGAQGEG